MDDAYLIISGIDPKRRYLAWKDKSGGLDHEVGPIDADVAAHIAACLDACRWRPIETAPKDGGWFLAIGRGPDNENHISVFKWNGFAERFLDHDYNEMLFPTHWRQIGPLPEVTK